jgi:hypothetical protein
LRQKYTVPQRFPPLQGGDFLPHRTIILALRFSMNPLQIPLWKWSGEPLFGEELEDPLIGGVSLVEKKAIREGFVRPESSRSV